MLLKYQQSHWLRASWPVECKIAGAVLDAKKNPEYCDVWSKASGKEIGRLAEGLPTQCSSNLMTIIPQDRRKDVTYVRICVNYRPEKEDPNRVRITVGGDRINYPGDVGTPTADMLLVKLLFNSQQHCLNERRKFMSLDISNFYLNRPMKRYKYMRIKLTDIPEDVQAHYNLKDKATKDGFVYVKIRRGMYGLPQGGLIAQELLEKRLNKRGFYQSKYTPGLWLHRTRNIQFALVVDDSGIKYAKDEDAQKYLIDSITQFYDITNDKEGKRFIGLTSEWDYKKRQVHISLPGYVVKALARF